MSYHYRSSLSELLSSQMKRTWVNRDKTACTSAFRHVGQDLEDALAEKKIDICSISSDAIHVIAPLQRWVFAHEKAQVLCWQMKRSDRRHSSHLSETETTSVSIQKAKEETWFGSAENGRRSPVLCGQGWQRWGPLCRCDSLRTSHSKHGSQIHSSYLKQQLYLILWPSSSPLLIYFRQGPWSSVPTHQADYLARFDSCTKPKPQAHHSSEHSTECCSWQQC